MRGRDLPALAAVFAALLLPAAATASPVATTDADYSTLGRVFPDPLAGCSAAVPLCSPNAQGKLPALQFIQYLEFIEALKYMNSKPDWKRYMEVWPLDDGKFPGNDLGRLEFDPSAEYRSAGIPTTDLQRKKSDLIVVRVTDESVPDEGKARYALSLSIHGIERAGVEGGTRAMEDLVTARTTGKAGQPVVPRSLDPRAPSFADVLKDTIVYFTYPNPDGWRRGSISELGLFFQRYNGNGVDPNRDWPDIGFSFRPYSGLSEPETRAFAAFYDDVKRKTGDQFAAGDDLHGQPFADALSYTLLPHGRHDFAKDQRIRETAIAIHRASETALGWSPIIKPNDSPPDSGVPCVPGVAVGDVCAQIYGQTWGTVYDTINYTTTGALGDYFDSSIGLGADGIDNEMSFSHLDKNIVFEPHTEQLHVDGNKSLIYAHLAQISHPPRRVLDVPGRQAFVPNARLRRRERALQPAPPPGTRAQTDIQDRPGSLDLGSVGTAFPFEVERSGEVFSGGMRVEITQASLQGISVPLLALKVQCKGCDEHPGVTESDDWVTVAEDYNQSPLYLQAGLTASVNRPKPGQWRALLTGPQVARMNVDFSSGPATTDGATGGDDPPRLAGYDVANTDFFRDLNRFVVDPAERFVPLDPGAVIRGEQPLAGLHTLALADDPLPGAFAADERGRWFAALRAWVESGGNLVLTDGALRALPELTGIPAGAVKERTVYVGSMAFAEEEGADTTGRPLARGVRQPGARFSGGSSQMRRQTFEPTPVGFAIQNAETGTDESHARQWHVEKQAFKGAGGDIAATSASEGERDARADFDHVTLGEIPLGRGHIRIAGALLPQPSTEFDHPFGIEPYAVTYSGYIVACNLLDCEVRDGSARRCLEPGRIAGKRLGRAALDRRRAQQRRRLGIRLLGRRRGIDRYCLDGGGQLRLGYVRRRSRLALSSSPVASVKRVRRGTGVRALRKRLRGERRLRVGRNVWFLAPAKKARLVFKVRRGRVAELGLASKRPTRTRRGSRRLLRAFRL